VSVRRRLLGVDTGTVRVGLAVSDPDRKIASPLAVWQRHGAGLDADYFRRLVEAEEIGAIVVGLPVHLDSREGQKAAEARAFGEKLTAATGLPVVYWDERFTTVEAESHLWQAGLTHKRRKARRDQVAAQVMLQSFLDAGCPADVQAGPLETEGT
jgi:putative holliday junction resolvase